MEIKHGPFKGLIPEEHELFVVTDRQGKPVMRNDRIVRSWAVHARTRHVLEHFSPADHWSIRCEAKPGPFNLPDPDTWIQGQDGNPAMAMQPTMLFTASLLDEDGQIVATASTLKVINCVGAWEAGETKARARLYEALGLPSTPDAEEPDDTVKLTVAAVNSQIAGASAMTGTTSQDKLHPDAQAVIDATAGHKGKLAPQPSTHKEPKEELQAIAVAAPASASDASPATSPATADDATSSPAAPTKKRAAAPKAVDASVVDANLLSQIQARARLKGVEVPEFKSRKQAQDFYKELLRAA